MRTNVFFAISVWIDVNPQRSRSKNFTNRSLGDDFSFGQKEYLKVIVEELCGSTEKTGCLLLTEGGETGRTVMMERIVEKACMGKVFRKGGGSNQKMERRGT